jgi:hypothetical protein
VYASVWVAAGATPRATAAKYVKLIIAAATSNSNAKSNPAAHSLQLANGYSNSNKIAASRATSTSNINSNQYTATSNQQTSNSNQQPSYRLGGTYGGVGGTIWEI